MVRFPSEIRRWKADYGVLVPACVLATGFEHSVANMTLLTLTLIDNGGNEAITMGGYWFNLVAVTLGNMIGAILFVALPYHIGSREKKEDCYE